MENSIFLLTIGKLPWYLSCFLICLRLIQLSATDERETNKVIHIGAFSTNVVGILVSMATLESAGNSHSWSQTVF